MKFNINDLNLEALEEKVLEESMRIYKKPSTRKGRDFEEIKNTNRYGLAPEQYLIEKEGFKNNPKEYQDVLKNSIPVEVKTTEKVAWVKYHLQYGKDAKNTDYRNFPDIMYIFIGNRKTGEYYLENIYEWNGKDFCVQSCEAVV